MKHLLLAMAAPDTGPSVAAGRGRATPIFRLLSWNATSIVPRARRSESPGKIEPQEHERDDAGHAADRVESTPAGQQRRGFGGVRVERGVEQALVGRQHHQQREGDHRAEEEACG